MRYRFRKIQEHAEALREGVYDGAMVPVAMFAEHLLEQGELGSKIAEITATTTVADMVEAYVRDAAGQKELAEWAEQYAEDAQVDAEIDQVA